MRINHILCKLNVSNRAKAIDALMNGFISTALS